MKYTVWVDGTEVNDYYVTKTEAELIKTVWCKDGYTNVVIEEIKETYEPRHKCADCCWEDGTPKKGIGCACGMNEEFLNFGEEDA